MKKLILLLQRQKQFPLKSQGSSMLPLLQPDDIIYFKKSAFPRIITNDLVMVEKNKKIFTHRVIYKTIKYVVTKGDNNPGSYGKVYLHSIFYSPIIRPIVRLILD